MEWLEEALLPYWQYAKRTRRRTKIIVLAGGLLITAEGRHRAVSHSAAAVYQGLADIVAGYSEEKDKLIRHIDDDDEAHQAAEEDAVHEDNNTAHTGQDRYIEQMNNTTPLEALPISPIEENLSLSGSDSEESMQTAHSSMPSSRQSSTASLDLAVPEAEKQPHPAKAVATEYKNKQKQVSTPLPQPLEPLIKPQKSVQPPSPLVLRALLAAQGEDAFNFLEDLNVEFSDDDLPFG